MKNTLACAVAAVATFAALAALVTAPCAAQTSAPATPPATLTPRDPAEPDVQRTRLEDQGSRIDELRVRGQTRRVVVTPKAPGSKPYEIIMGNAGQAVPDGTGGANSAAGKRVWNVFSF